MSGRRDNYEDSEPEHHVERLAEYERRRRARAVFAQLLSPVEAFVVDDLKRGVEPHDPELLGEVQRRFPADDTSPQDLKDVLRSIRAKALAAGLGATNQAP